MKKIKIKICKYDPSDQCSFGFYLITLLQKHYEVELTENPDYLFYNESDHEHVRHDCIKIFYTGENVHPNFNFCDYAFGFDYMSFGDRYCRFPVYFIATFYREKELRSLRNFDMFSPKPFTLDELKSKTGFCSFVYSNYLASPDRKEFFDILSSYKKIRSGGRYLNNTNGPVDNKLDFEGTCKFSIAFENSSNEGYTTEKLLNSLAARTIPIYWGNPIINLEFNEKRFINCHRFGSFKEVLERVREIDSNDELFLKIINEPLFVENQDPRTTEDAFETFIKNIFVRPVGDAKRIRINPACRKDMLRDQVILFRMNRIKNSVKKILAKIYQPFKTIALLERIKQDYFISRSSK